MEQGNNKETVILLHGMLRTGKSMRTVQYYLGRKGYDVISITYPANKHNLQELTEFLHDQLKLSDSFNKASKVHFVTHSMGGILTRYYLSKFRPANLGRVVMMGPPNQGTELADFMTDKKRLGPIFQKVFGPAGQEMRASHKHNDKPVDYEIGVIAGSISINPLAPYVLEDDNDGIVSVESTRLDGMKDHIVMKSTHSFMMYNPKVMRQIDHFLKNGTFQHKP